MGCRRGGVPHPLGPVRRGGSENEEQEAIAGSRARETGAECGLFHGEAGGAEVCKGAWVRTCK